MADPKLVRFSGAAILCALLLAPAFLAPVIMANPETHIGEQAPGFDLPRVDGEGRVSLEAVLEQGPAALLWLSPKCPYSRACDERYQETHEALADKGIALVAINSNRTEAPADLAAYAERAGWTFPLVYDARNAVADAYDASKTPEVVLISQDGKIVYRGLIDDSVWESEEVGRRYLLEAAEAMLAGSRPDPEVTEPMGCTIKRVPREAAKRPGGPQ